MPRATILLIFFVSFSLSARAQSIPQGCPDGPFKAKHQTATIDTSTPKPTNDEEPRGINRPPPEIEQIQSGMVRSAGGRGGTDYWLGYDAQRSVIILVLAFVYSDKIPDDLAIREVEPDETLRQFNIGALKRLEVIRRVTLNRDQKLKITCLMNRALAEHESNRKASLAQEEANPGDPNTQTVITHADGYTSSVFRLDDEAIYMVDEPIMEAGSYGDYFKLKGYMLGFFPSSHSGITYGSKLGDKLKAEQ